MLPHLKVFPSDLSPYAVVVGDAKRVSQVAVFLENAQVIGENREYTTLTGNYRKKKISVVSHGIGAGGANICFMELFRGGVHTIIRAGTCGALDIDIKDGENIIVSGAVREDAATQHLMPLPYPAVVNIDVFNALINASKKKGGSEPITGLVVTYANFYSSPVVQSQYKKYLGYGVKALDMETAALLVVALMKGARAGTILTVDGNVIRMKEESTDEFEYNPYRPIIDKGITNMVKITLEALYILMQKDYQNG